MNKENLNYLKESLKYLGFGDKLYPELEKNMEQGFLEFILKTNTTFKEQVLSAALHFKQSSSTGLYFFNRYDAELERPSGDRTQIFYIHKGQGITLKEAFNLLEGRAVHKELTNSEGQKYNAWLQLNFKELEDNGNYKVRQFHQNYGFDLEKTLAKYPIREFSNEQQKEMLLRSLQKGNTQVATFEKDGIQKLFFLEAAPQFKSVNVYDHAMQKIAVQSLNENFKKNVVSNKVQEQSNQQGISENTIEKKQVAKKESLAPKDDGNSIGKSVKRKGKSKKVSL